MMMNAAEKRLVRSLESLFKTMEALTGYGAGKSCPPIVSNHISLAVALYCPAGSVEGIIQLVLANIRSVIQETA
jgi:hypothetical protein